jgi:hypothetical protein
MPHHENELTRSVAAPFRIPGHHAIVAGRSSSMSGCFHDVNRSAHHIDEL